MKLTTYGAAQGVTGSKYLLEVSGQRLLLECGFFQGKRKDTYSKNLNFEFDPASLDAVILSHAHIDHSGNLPNLVKKGFSKNIYATPATCALADVMLQDSGKIQENDAEFVNKRKIKRGETDLAQPIYTQEEAKAVAGLFSPQPYEKIFYPIPGVSAQFVDAGHILGSAAVVLDIREDGRNMRVWFSGDIGRKNLPLLRDPILPEKVDYLLMECTYGDKSHEHPDVAYEEFTRVAQRTFDRRGKIIVPAFAVGRTQEIVYHTNRLTSAGILPRFPVYVDSPLALRATRVFQDFDDLFDEETHEFVREGNHPALAFPGLTYIESVAESKSLNDREDPMMIISASGMMEAGRVLHHLRNNIGNPRNTIMIVSWQSPDTLGRRLAEGAKNVRIYGDNFQVRAEVVSVRGFSAHAGQEALLSYVMNTRETLRKVILVHGEPGTAEAFREKLNENGIHDVIYPMEAETIELA